MPERRRSVPHRTRPPHAKRHPVHITLRARREHAFFTRESVRQLVRRILWKLTQRGDFRIAHFSIQEDHLHLLVEADDKQRLSSGIRSFVITFALRLNRLLGRRSGKVWADRYHRHDLKGPTETRNALGYVLCNFRKHARVYGDALVDRNSSALRFGGWSRPTAAKLLRSLDHDTEPWPPIVARTWLLGIGWQRGGGLIDPSYTPPLRS